jgi:hypothetical protein
MESAPALDPPQAGGRQLKRQTAEERGITHFVAEVLCENRAMLEVFREALTRVRFTARDRRSKLSSSLPAGRWPRFASPALRNEDG